MIDMQRANRLVHFLFSWNCILWYIVHYCCHDWQFSAEIQTSEVIFVLMKFPCNRMSWVIKFSHFCRCSVMLTLKKVDCNVWFHHLCSCVSPSLFHEHYDHYNFVINVITILPLSSSPLVLLKTFETYSVSSILSVLAIWFSFLSFSQSVTGYPGFGTSFWHYFSSHLWGSVL